MLGGIIPDIAAQQEHSMDDKNKSLIGRTEFNKELAALINKHSMENGSDIPDFILADYLESCLRNFGNTIRNRELFYKK